MTREEAIEEAARALLEVFGSDVTINPVPRVMALRAALRRLAEAPTNETDGVRVPSVIANRLVSEWHRDHGEILNLGSPAMVDLRKRVETALRRNE